MHALRLLVAVQRGKFESGLLFRTCVHIIIISFFLHVQVKPDSIQKDSFRKTLAPCEYVHFTWYKTAHYTVVMTNVGLAESYRVNHS